MPGTFFYGEILKAHNDRFKEGFIPGVPAFFKISTKPSDKVELTHSFKIKKSIVHEAIEGAEEEKEVAHYSEKNQVDLKIECGQFEFETQVKNQALKFADTFSPKDFNNDSKTLQLQHSSKYYPAKQLYKMGNYVNFGSPELGPLRLWINLGFDWQKKFDGEKTTTIKNSTNIQIKNDYHVGYELEHDTNEVTKLDVQAVWTSSKGEFFLKGDTKKKQWTLGCSHHHCNKKHYHSTEITYSLNKDKPLEGIQGKPVKLRWVGEYGLTDNITLKSALKFKKHAEIQNLWIQKVDERLTVAFSSKGNLTNAIWNPKATNIEFGAQCTYDL